MNSSFPIALWACLLLLNQMLSAQESRPEYNTGSGFFVKNGSIYDPAGEAFIPMGYNTSAFWGSNADCKRANMSTYIPNSGANAVRIVSQTQGAFGWNANPTDQRDLVDRAVQAHMVPMLEMHNATCDEPNFETIVSYWTSTEMVKLCQDYEPFLWVNIANEHNFSSFEDWRDSYIATVRQFRDAGIKNLIVIDAGKNCGQNPEMFTKYGMDVLNADPEKNVVFSIHLYGFWRTQDRGFSGWTPPYSVETDLAALKNAGLPLIVGEFGWDAPEGFAGNYKAETIITTCKENGIGWYFWSFFDGSDKPYYSTLKSVCGGIGESNLTEAGKFILPYLQANAQTAGIFSSVPTFEAGENSAVRIHPNPVNGTFTIRGLEKPTRIWISDLSGRFIRSIKVHNEPVDISDLAEGVYFIRMDGQAFKIVKH